MLLLGDTNCDLTPKQAGLPIDNNSKHMQLVMEPTRVTLTTTSIIDHIATTCAGNIVGSGVHKISMSDHYMIYCIRKFNGAVEKDHKMIKTRKMKNFNEDEFLADVSAICWEQLAPGKQSLNFSKRDLNLAL